MKKILIILIVITCNCKAQKHPIITHLNEFNILSAIYNNYDEGTKSSKWLVKENSIIKEFFNKEKIYLYTSIKSIIDSIKFNEEKFAVVVTQTKPEDYDCHFCAPLVGIILVENIDNSWVVKYNIYLDLIGSWGEISTPKIELIGKHKYGISFETGLTGQGFTNTKFILYELQQDTINKILIIDDFSGDNEGICDTLLNNCWKYSSIYYFKKSSDSNYYDLIVNKSGTKIENNKIKAFNSMKIYEYVNGKYNLKLY